MHRSSYKKWLTVTNDVFMKNVSNKIKDSRKMLEGNDELFFSIKNQQWIGKCLQNTATV